MVVECGGWVGGGKGWTSSWGKGDEEATRGLYSERSFGKAAHDPSNRPLVMSQLSLIQPMGGVKKVRPPPLWLSSIVSDSASDAAGDRPLCDVTKGGGVHHGERNPLPGFLLCGRLPPPFPNLRRIQQSFSFSGKLQSSVLAGGRKHGVHFCL